MAHVRRNFGLCAALACLVAFGILAGGGQAMAQDGEDRAVVEKKAEAFLEGVGDQRCSDLYRQLGKRMREFQGEEGFVAQCSVVRQQVGGKGQGRRLVDFQRGNQLPGPEGMAFGEFAFVRFATRYPVGPVYEDVYLEKEEDDVWRVVGWWLNPAPG